MLYLTTVLLASSIIDKSTVIERYQKCCPLHEHHDPCTLVEVGERNYTCEKTYANYEPCCGRGGCQVTFDDDRYAVGELSDACIAAKGGRCTSRRYDMLRWHALLVLHAQHELAQPPRLLQRRRSGDQRFHGHFRQIVHEKPRGGTRHPLHQDLGLDQRAESSRRLEHAVHSVLQCRPALRRYAANVHLPAVTIEHQGLNNVRAALDDAQTRWASATKILVAGSSAGVGGVMTHNGDIATRFRVHRAIRRLVARRPNPPTST